MADAAVEFLLNNLKDLVVQHSNLITKTKSDIQSLESDLLVFQAFLKDSVKRRRKDEPTRALVRNIRDAVYEVEDIIDAFVTQALEIKTTPYFLRFFKGPVNLHGIGTRVEGVRVKVQKSWDQIAILAHPDQDKPDKPEARPPRKKDVVGFKDVTEGLIRRLNTETADYLDVISVTGTFGLGKTTVAYKVFNDPDIIYKFPVRIWLTISQEFSAKDKFLKIIETFVTLTDDMHKKDEHELAKIAADHLESGKFLIVMDDVWESRDWEALTNIALPEHNNLGKVMITTRHTDVGKHASRPRPPFELRYFDDDESWELLRREALGKLEFHPDLEDVGRLIAKDCKGLPLAVVVIGGILGNKYFDTDVKATKKAWDKVSERVSAYLITNEDPKDQMNMFISLSYNKLPYDLRACFLYLGMFPEDYEIPVSKLIRMWIAEGFIQQNEHGCNLEETAEKYLEDLINRNLVRVDKMKPNGKVKTCRIHDALHDFCRTEAGIENENFLQEIKYTNQGTFVPPVGDVHKYRRLSIHSNYLNFFSSSPVGHRVRSFVCFSKDKNPLPLQMNSSAIPAAFKLLRVLDVKLLQFTKIHTDMYHLVHVRYIAFSFTLSILPPKFSNFHNLQTLIVDTTSRTLTVKADIWKMVQLRHFKTNATAILPKPIKDSKKHCAELQTLDKIAVESCTPELFDWACNLKKLGISGKLADLFQGKNGSVDSLEKMKHLETLKLINDLYPNAPSLQDNLLLPNPCRFPSGLRSLTLVATFLRWSNMSTLGSLENLEVLKLEDKAFMGTTWELKAVGFPSLEFLHIDQTDLAVWKASSHHFGKLKGLVLRNCEELFQIPIELAEIPSFTMLDLNNCKSAAASARKIQVKKSKKEAQGSSAFKLYIFPHEL